MINSYVHIRAEIFFSLLSPPSEKLVAGTASTGRRASYVETARGMTFDRYLVRHGFGDGGFWPEPVFHASDRSCGASAAAAPGRRSTIAGVPADVESGDARVRSDGQVRIRETSSRCAAGTSPYRSGSGREP